MRKNDEPPAVAAALRAGGIKTMADLRARAPAALRRAIARPFFGGQKKGRSRQPARRATDGAALRRAFFITYDESQKKIFKDFLK